MTQASGGDAGQPLRSEAVITVEGKMGDAESLWDWLRHEPKLRGRLEFRSAPTPGGAMGAPMELVVVFATSATALAPALARCLSTWLVQRRADLTIKVTGPDGKQVSVSSRRVANPEKLLRAVLESNPSSNEPGR